MKNELGIEICGENCKGDVIPPYDCPKCGQKKCGDENCQYFSPKTKLLKQRINELQERVEDLKFCLKMEGLYSSDYREYLRNKIKKLESQQFTKEELQFIKRAVLEYSEMSDFDYKPVNEKIERIINEQLNKQR